MRTSAFRNTWGPNLRPYVTLTPDAYVSLQGETSVIGCGECRREVNFNHYITAINTEASIDSPPGSATITLSIPDNDVNDFYVDGQFIIIPMMEVEIFAKGYFTVGGIPQYYKIFWGMVQTATKTWSNGVTNIQIQCKDILRWWELTNTILNPAFLNSFGSSAGGYQLFQNQYASMNPYTVIVQLAKEAMGDFSLTQGSMTAFTPEHGPEAPVIGSYAKDIMAYWQLKFSNIWNSLVLYGSSGRSYTFAGEGGTVSGIDITATVLADEAKIRNRLGDAAGQDALTQQQIKVLPETLAAFKTELARAGDVDFFQTESQSKLAVAMTCRDQAGYEFYCDTTGDIIFKPPFYNLNVIPNKPVSWIQDYEIIEDSVVDTELDVFTHITSSGNAFSGGSLDYGLNDEITTPRCGVYDFHLLRRYGWRRLDYQCEWASNPRQLFFHLIDHLDRVNSKRQNGSIIIPMRPELRMGFPIWFPRYDSFFYIQAIAHQYAVGGQATTTLTLTAKRSKFIAPNNIGTIKQDTIETPVSTGGKKSSSPSTATAPSKKQKTYTITFPQDPGETSGIAQSATAGEPKIIRDPTTGKRLGYPNVVMVYQKPFDGDLIAKINQASLDPAGAAKAKKSLATSKGSATAASPKIVDGFTYDKNVASVAKMTSEAEKAKTLQRLRAHRYEAGMTNFGAYDYAHDVGGFFLELALIPVDLISWGSGTTDATSVTGTVTGIKEYQKQLHEKLDGPLTDLAAGLFKANLDLKTKSDILSVAKAAYSKEITKIFGGKKHAADQLVTPDLIPLKMKVDAAQRDIDSTVETITRLQATQKSYRSLLASGKAVANLNMLVRPVSDEFGFELIGHYRYGRGTFIDQGKIQIAGPGKTVANKLNVQFAATGGLMTDPTSVNIMGPESTSFAASFEDMRPDDFVTGASMDAGASSVTLTSQNTYDMAILNSSLRTGQTVFADADATRRGLTLAELKPTIQNDGLAGGFEKCSCQLSKPSWLSVLPQSSIDQVLRDNPISGIASASNTGSFFDILNAYLVERFNTNYSANANREANDVGVNVGSFNPDNASEDTNVLGDPSNPLFNAAANGDPDAIAALAQQANFNFGQTDDALKNFKRTANDGIDASRASLQNVFAQSSQAFNANPFGISATTKTPVQQAVVDAQATLTHAALDLQQAEQFVRQNPNSDEAKRMLALAQAAYASAVNALNNAKVVAGEAIPSSGLPSQQQQAIAAYQSRIAVLQRQADALRAQIQSIRDRDESSFIASDVPYLISLEEQLQNLLNQIAIQQFQSQATLQTPENVSVRPQLQLIAPTQSSTIPSTKFNLNPGAFRNGTKFTS